MHKLITNKQKYTVFHDEQKDLFILLSTMAIYKHSEELLSVICWKKSTVDSMVLQGLNIDEPWRDDENFYEFKVNIEYFQKLFAYNTYTEANQYTKTWLQKKSQKLGHEITRHYVLR